MRRWRVGVLGATGLVGRRLVRGLADHPWFELVGVAASERSVGRGYGEALQRAGWVESIPAAAAGLAVRPCDPAAHGDCELILSALDATTARTVEDAFRGAGLGVVTNSSAFRMHDDVPLVIPEVNAAHVDLIAPAAGRGFIVANPNCSTIGLALALAPLHRAFGVRRVVVATLQAVSGAGIEGPRALALLDNAIPEIPGEEGKIEEEVGKILGVLRAGRIERLRARVSAHCHRVPVVDGHLEAVSVEFERPPSPAAAEAALAEFSGDVAGLGLPSAPARPIVVRPESDRPQPRLDRDAGDGMSVVVGRVRECPVLGLKFELLSHNMVRGAAGGTLLLAELLVARGLVGGGAVP